MSKSGDISFDTLLIKCRQGDRKAQEILYRLFYPLMMPVCMGYVKQVDDAMDIYNRSFLKVFAKLDEYKGEGPFAGWIRKIVVHTAIDFIRKEEKNKNNVNIEDAHIQSSGENPMDTMLTNDVLSIMKTLPPIQRIVVNLYIVEGYNHNEIAKMVGIQPGTSKWHLSEGRKRLKKLLTNAGIKG